MYFRLDSRSQVLPVYQLHCEYERSCPQHRNPGHTVAFTFLAQIQVDW